MTTFLIDLTKTVLHVYFPENIVLGCRDVFPNVRCGVTSSGPQTLAITGTLKCDIMYDLLLFSMLSARLCRFYPIHQNEKGSLDIGTFFVSQWAKHTYLVKDLSKVSVFIKIECTLWRTPLYIFKRQKQRFCWVNCLVFSLALWSHIRASYSNS